MRKMLSSMFLMLSSVLWAQEQFKISQEIPADFSGVVFWQTKEGEEHFWVSGMTNREEGIPLTKESIFDIASLNKSFQSYLVLLAVQEGRWTLDSHLNDLLKRYGLESSFSNEITLHHLLSHRAGLADYDALPDSLKANDFHRFRNSRFSPREYLNLISSLNQVGDVDGQFHYSNFGYHLLALLLEWEYQKDFSELLVQKLIRPMNMDTALAYTYKGERGKGIVTAYQKQFDKWRPNPYTDLSLGRRIFANAPAMLQWARMQYQEEGPLNFELLASSHRNQQKEEDEVAYGYGWVPMAKGERSKMGDLGIAQSYIIHGGSTEGYQSILVVVKEGEFIIGALCNSGHGALIFELMQKCIHEKYMD